MAKKHRPSPPASPASSPPSAAGNAATTRDARAWTAAIVALLTFIVYTPALLNGFVNWDDDLYVYGNPHILSLKPAFFAWAFTDLSAGFWHPITWISYALDHAVWGLNPLGYHLTAILLHAVNTGLVVLLADRLLAAARRAPEVTSSPDDRSTLLAAGITGLLFGLHPLHVESVVWISERKDLLCALFFLLSLLAYLRYAVPAGARHDVAPATFLSERKWYLPALLCFICALAAKTMAVSLPLVFLILDWYPLNRFRTTGRWRGLLLEKVPFFLASLAIAVVSITAQKSIGALVLMDSKPFGTRLLVAVKALATYLMKMLLPVNLLPFYPYPEQVSPGSAEYLLAVLLVAGITAVCIGMVRTRPYLAASWGYYLVTLLPVLGFIQVGIYAMADRFTYLPSLGPFLLLGLGGASIGEKLSASRAALRVAAAGVLILAALLSLVTIRYLTVWRTSIDLWNYVIAREPHRTPYPYINRGVAFGDRKEFPRAIEDFSTALSISPASGDIYLNRGMAYVAMGQIDRGIADYDRALQLNPRYVDAYSNRGSAHYRMGSLDRAVADYDRALALQPDFVPALVNRGMVLKKKGELDRAIADYSRAVALTNEARCLISRGDLYLMKGDVERAVNDYRQACAGGSREGCDKALLPGGNLLPAQR